jgi:NDP-sugar pyrophosphorylase family protein
MKHINESIIGRRGVDYHDYQKYELANEPILFMGHTLYRIKALKSIPSKNVKKGDLGGWVESYNNLDQKGDCWVADDAYVYSNAEVSGNAKVYGNANVYGNAKVFDNAEVYDAAQVNGYAHVFGNAKVYGRAEVYGDAQVFGNAEICSSAKVDYYINSRKITK